MTSTRDENNVLLERHFFHFIIRHIKIARPMHALPEFIACFFSKDGKQMSILPRTKVTVLINEDNKDNCLTDEDNHRSMTRTHVLIYITLF
jgi:hypothetical protein